MKTEIRQRFVWVDGSNLARFNPSGQPPVFTLYGCGAQPVLWGLILLLIGIPVYVWQRRRASWNAAAAKP